MYVPYKTQHQILVRVQCILEHACFEFAENALPDVLEKEEWECPESVELNKWSRIFSTNQNKLPMLKFAELGKPLEQVLASISQLRHTAVHRLRITAKHVEQFVKDAELLVNLLGNDSHSKKLAQIRREVQSSIGELQRNKDLLESRLAERLKEIALQRAELDRLERTAVQEMLDEDKENQLFVGACLNSTLTLMALPREEIEESATIGVMQAADTDSEADLDVQTFAGGASD